MAVLWCGGEDIDFPNGSICSATTASQMFRNGYARCAVGPSSPSAGPVKGTLFTPVTSCWLSSRFYLDGNFSALFVYNAIGLESFASGGYGIFVGVNGNGKVTIAKGFQGATVLATSSALYVTQSLTGVNMQVANYGPNGTVNVYINGTLAVSYTGDITNPGMSAIDCVSIGNNNNWGERTWCSEIIVADEPTLGWQGLVTCAPNGNGTTQQWQNPDDSNYNEISLTDGSSVYTDVVGKDEQATLIPVPAGNFAIKAVKVAARALGPEGSVPTGIQLGFNNGTTTALGATHTITSAFALYEDLFTTDPITGQPWASLTGYQIDMRSA